MTDKLTIIDKIRKLQALAERGVGGEAENAAKMISKLLTKHRIDMAELDVEDQDEIQKGDATMGGTSSWERQLAYEIAKHYDCRYAYSRKRVWTKNSIYPKWHRRFKEKRPDTIVGFAEDVALAEYLYVIAKRQIESELKDAKRRGRVHGRRGANVWRISMVFGLRDKLAEIKREENQENPGYAIIVADRKSQVNDWVESECSHWSSGRPTNYNTRRDAYNKGKAMDIQTGINGRNSQLKLGTKR
jgi:hypothetical protein